MYEMALASKMDSRLRGAYDGLVTSFEGFEGYEATRMISWSAVCVIFPLNGMKNWWTQVGVEFPDSPRPPQTFG